jgi:membrane protein DedA with SNARE-associated domain
MKAKHYLKLFSAPLLCLALFLSLTIGWRVFHLPPIEELTRMINRLFDTYGLPVLFLSALLEGMLLIGSYFPGVFVIFIGVIASNTPYEAALVIIVATTALIISHSVNYFLGKYGWHRVLLKFGMKHVVEKAQERLQKKGPIAIALSYWSPSFAAMTDTAAGIIQMPFKIFFIYSVLASIFWNSIVGTAVYFAGDKALVVASGGGTGSLTDTGPLIAYGIVIIWMGILLYKDRRETR